MTGRRPRRGGAPRRPPGLKGRPRRQPPGCAAAPSAPPKPFRSPDISGLLARIRSYDPKADIGLVDARLRLAAQAHRTQKRDNGDPYIVHPVAVAEILAGYRLDIGTIATALLHESSRIPGSSCAEIERGSGPRSPAWWMASPS